MTFHAISIVAHAPAPARDSEHRALSSIGRKHINHGHYVSTSCQQFNDMEHFGEARNPFPKSGI